ncbi:Peptidyl-prolyl cis-trans isomerase CWC27 like protein [Eufriesea mexicana]|uniref:Peptidyl-prolyl cis-trans isomerase CWC27 like protein n=1 Tax=Eufriesea mexicana TaxID=516756 RepID=A0A310SL66_9HYME|nr:Peptidyl-prolyl cis-trans isomerase CWC27 like protein [Eufriesea mexicana]
MNNPFADIIPRIIVPENEEVKNSSKTETAAVKYKSYMFAEFSPGRIILCYEKFCYRHFNLLSFGEKGVKDVEESVILNKKFSGKGKSTHDHSTDPKLSSQPAVEPPGLANKKRKEGRSSDWENDDEVKTQEELEFVKKEKEAMKERIKDTLRDTKKEPKKVQNYKIDDFEDDKGRISYKITFLLTRFNCYLQCWKDDNGSQYFFILSCTPELLNKHTIFGEVTGESIYSMLKLEEVLVDENDKPLYPSRLIKPIILNNSFFDIIPRIIGTGNDFNLLSFGEESEEEEKEYAILNKKFSDKGKSTHDHSTDPKLSSQPAVEPPGLAIKKRKEGRSSDWENDDEVKTQEELEFVKKEKEAMKKRIKDTLKAIKKEPKKVQNYKIDDFEDDKGIKESE